MTVLHMFLSNHVDHLLQDGWTPLHWAVNQDNVAVVRLLLEHSASINAKDNVSYHLFYFQ